MIKKILNITLLITLINTIALGQFITNSPYTRFGIGEIDRNGFNNSKAMGGISTGLRVENQINYMNPAAISAQDTMSFIFDLGLNGIFKSLETNVDKANFTNVSFDHLAISFPIQRWWYASVGVTPYSMIGYNIQQTQASEFADTVNYHYDYYGNGGITQLFIANSFKISKHLAIGINTNYLFGSIEQYNMAYVDYANYETLVKTNYNLRKLAFDFGAQYFGEINSKYFYLVGVTYSNKINFNTAKETSILNTDNYHSAQLNVIDYITKYSSQLDTVPSSFSTSYEVKVPERYSVGFSAGIKNKLTFGFDYSLQDWSNIKSLNIDNNFDKDQTYNFGIEYIPNQFALRNYFKKINYRAGFYYNESYLKFDGNQILNYGITFGLGFPIMNRKTTVNVSYVYGTRGTKNNGLIEENYSSFGINLTLYDFWFFKRKIQ